MVPAGTKQITNIVDTGNPCQIYRLVIVLGEAGYNLLMGNKITPPAPSLNNQTCDSASTQSLPELKAGQIPQAAALNLARPPPVGARSVHYIGRPQ
jgi:hypothetical protein